jgi:hypothetical protein
MFIQKIPAKNSGPLQKVAPHLGRKDLAKIRRARNSGISGPRKFWFLRISSPRKFWFLRISGAFRKAASQPFVKDLA